MGAAALRAMACALAFAAIALAASPAVLGAPGVMRQDCSATVPPQNPCIAAPSIVSRTQTEAQLEIRWQPVPAAVAYRVYRSDTLNSTFGLVKVVTDERFAEEKSNLPLYSVNFYVYYRVTATDGLVESAYAEADFFILYEPPPQPETDSQAPAMSWALPVIGFAAMISLVAVLIAVDYVSKSRKSRKDIEEADWDDWEWDQSYTWRTWKAEAGPRMRPAEGNVIDQLILDFIRKRPGLDPQKISGALGLDADVVRSKIKNLEVVGKVVGIQMDGVGDLEYFIPGEEAQRAYFKAQEAQSVGPSPYRVLGVAEQAQQEDVKAAYRKLSKKWHPDCFAHFENKELMKQAEARYLEINTAYHDIERERGWA